MKKTLAVSAASLLGLTGAVAGMAAPAQAAMPADCADGTGHVLGAAAVDTDDWYMDCTPLYGLGKTEFTITSDVDFPADFVPLNDSTVTVASTVDAATAQTYDAPAGPAIGNFTNMVLDSTVPVPGTQKYRARALLPIASIEKIDQTLLPTSCAVGSYASAYRITYTPTSTTFTQTASGEEWEYDIAIAAEPLYIGFSISAPGVFDVSAPFCVASTSGVQTGADSSAFAWAAARALATDGISTLAPFYGDIVPTNIGSFARVPAAVVPPVVVPPAAPQPTLAETGPEAVGPALLGGGLILAGLSLALVSRRRRAAAAS